jgi:hypothetical protein
LGIAEENPLSNGRTPVGEDLVNGEPIDDDEGDPKTDDSGDTFADLSDAPNGESDCVELGDDNGLIF